MGPFGSGAIPHPFVSSPLRYRFTRSSPEGCVRCDEEPCGERDRGLAIPIREMNLR